MRTPRSTRSSTPSDVSAGRGGTPGRVRGFTRGAPRVRPGGRPGCASGGTSEYVGAIPGRSRDVPGHACRGPLRARVPAASRTTRGTRRRTTARGPRRVRPCEGGPGGSGRSTTRAAPDRNRPHRVRTTHDPPLTRTELDRPGRGRTGRAASRTTESPPRRAPRVRPRGPAPMHDLRGLGPRTTAGVRPRARRAGLGPRTTERVGPGGRPARGSGRARPCGVRTAHDRAGLGLCTTVRGSGRVRPGRLSPGCDRTGSWTLYDREGPPRVGSRGSAPAQTVRSRAAYDRARRRPRTARACFACVRPCGACPAYDPVRGFDHVRPEGPLRSAR